MKAKAVATVYEFRGLYGCRSKCGLWVVPVKDGRTAVICTELPDNPGTSITNFAEELATLVCKDYGIDPEKLVWIEHYPPDNPRHGLRRGKASYDLVRFAIHKHATKVRLLEPKWRPMTYKDWQDLGFQPEPPFSHN